MVLLAIGDDENRFWHRFSSSHAITSFFCVSMTRILCAFACMVVVGFPQQPCTMLYLSFVQLPTTPTDLIYNEITNKYPFYHPVRMEFHFPFGLWTLHSNFHGVVSETSKVTAYFALCFLSSFLLFFFF